MPFYRRTVSGDSINLTKTDDGTLGPNIISRAESGSPAAADYVAYWNMFGKDSGGNDTLYGAINVRPVNVTDGSEAAYMTLQSIGGSVIVTNVNAFTVATLNTNFPPSATLRSARSFVTDALGPTWGATVVGGGAVRVPVYCDGVNWIVG